MTGMTFQSPQFLSISVFKFLVIFPMMLLSSAFLCCCVLCCARKFYIWSLCLESLSVNIEMKWKRFLNFLPENFLLLLWILVTVLWFSYEMKPALFFSFFFFCAWLRCNPRQRDELATLEESVGIASLEISLPFSLYSPPPLPRVILWKTERVLYNGPMKIQWRN